MHIFTKKGSLPSTSNDFSEHFQEGGADMPALSHICANSFWQSLILGEEVGATLLAQPKFTPLPRKYKVGQFYSTFIRVGIFTNLIDPLSILIVFARCRSRKVRINNRWRQRGGLGQTMVGGEPANWTIAILADPSPSPLLPLHCTALYFSLVTIFTQQSCPRPLWSGHGISVVPTSQLVNRMVHMARPATWWPLTTPWATHIYSSVLFKLKFNQDHHKYNTQYFVWFYIKILHPMNSEGWNVPKYGLCGFALKLKHITEQQFKDSYLLFDLTVHLQLFYF